MESLIVCVLEMVKALYIPYFTLTSVKCSFKNNYFFYFKRFMKKTHQNKLALIMWYLIFHKK